MLRDPRPLQLREEEPRVPLPAAPPCAHVSPCSPPCAPLLAPRPAAPPCTPLLAPGPTIPPCAPLPPCSPPCAPLLAPRPSARWRVTPRWELRSCSCRRPRLCQSPPAPRGRRPVPRRYSPTPRSPLTGTPSHLQSSRCFSSSALRPRALIPPVPPAGQGPGFPRPQVSKLRRSLAAGRKLTCGTNLQPLHQNLFFLAPFLWFAPNI